MENNTLTKNYLLYVHNLQTKMVYIGSTATRQCCERTINGNSQSCHAWFLIWCILWNAEPYSTYLILSLDLHSSGR